ncbi:MAG TPA: glutamate synthase large subunit, partial [Terriglobales bacterium]|nr:glutamate synthase large subunit [Terriglobales bacterium]
MEWQNPSPSRDHDACGVGFIAQLGGGESREVIERALTALERLSHRGGVDADGASGDGAGLLTAIPRRFFRDQARQAGIQLPSAYAVGMVFLPRELEKGEEACRCIVESVDAFGLKFLGLRQVPTNPGALGHRAESTLPVIRQVFFAPLNPAADFEMQLFLFRKRVEAIAPSGTYFCSLSSRTLVYKGLLAPHQLVEFYPDVAHPEFKSPFAVFHQRYSTNTRPVWSLAQPFRLVAHNGEINTISANRRWMRARETSVRRAFGAGEDFRCLQEHVSDSASFDNSFEILIRRNLNPAAAMMRMVPPAWENDTRIQPELRAFLQSQACEQEPWDGPAALVFSDGQYVGAKLDRNGLRPMRFTVGNNGLVVAGSEVGIADLAERQIEHRGRLGPGEMILVDLLNGTLHRNHELSGLLMTAIGAPARPAVSYLLPSEPADGPAASSASFSTQHPRRTAAALGWTEDQFRILFQPLCAEGKEAVWSMGDDAPPAFLSEMQRPLWDYCKQRFAQVTNPPIDPLRETHVMSLDLLLAGDLGLRSPILDAGQMEKLASHLDPACRIDITFESAKGVKGAVATLASVRGRVMAAAFLAPRMVVLSDREVGRDRAALPVLLAVATAWKAMVSTGAIDVPIVVESGQVFDTHHVALLVACGASAVFPYLAMELAEDTAAGGQAKFRAALEGGLRKVLARMGISTLASYRNSHLFETVGLEPEVHQEFFEDTASVLAGKSLNEILEDSLVRHAAAFAEETQALRDLGYYRFRKNGELHATSPELVRHLHAYIKSPTPENNARYQRIAGTRESVAVRDNLDFRPAEAVALDEVEPRESIVTRFSSQAMSLGAISPEAHKTLAIAMNRIGARSNTGEGGEDPEIYMNSPEASNRVKQVASGRFGVTADYLVHADELEIKMAQGSKPGEGGQLPGFKVTPYIARMRHAVTGMSLISPPPHHDIYSIEDLAQLIYDLRAINPRARIGVKLVAGAGVGIIAAGVAKAGAGVITISGHDGGTGASPLTSIKNTGLPWEVGIREAHCELLQAGLRSRVRLRVDGGLKFGRDVVVAALLGADEFGFGTAALLAIGCVMARQCHLNTCPVGIATQDETLRTRFTGKPEMVVSYFEGVADEVRQLLSNLGARSLQQIRGRVDLLEPRQNASAKT